MKNILIICTGNTCRSPMAEGILNNIIKNKKIQDKYKIKSAGIFAFDNEDANQNAVIAMKSMNIDISNHKAKKISLEELKSADIIYVMTSEHKEIVSHAILDINNKAIIMDIEDPYGKTIDDYVKCAYQILNFFNKTFIDND